MSDVEIKQKKKNKKQKKETGEKYDENLKKFDEIIDQEKSTKKKKKKKDRKRSHESKEVNTAIKTDNIIILKFDFFNTAKTYKIFSKSKKRYS